MLKIYIGRNAGRAVCLTLPATREETDRAFADIGSAGSEVPVLIQEAETSVPHLEERLKGLSYEKKEDREALDFLAERIGYLTQEEQDVFSAVFRMEDPGSLEETINLSYNLDQYKLLPFGFDQEELSRILVKRDTGVEIPVEVAEFLDHEKVYSAYFLHHKGEFWYYVKKKYKLNVDFLSNQWNPIPPFSAIMSSKSSNSVTISSRNS